MRECAAVPRGFFRRAAGLLPLLLALVFAFAGAARAQTYRGAIRGEVHDASGGALVGAKVTAKNTATDFSRSATTVEDGGYVIPELPAGEYEVTAEAKDLSPVMQKAVVEVGADTPLDFTVSKVAATSEKVSVTATAPLIETSNDALGGIVDNRLVAELPLNGRDFGKLVALVPGATVDPSGVAGTEKGFGQFNINGNRDRSNNYTLDGTDNNDPWFNNSALNQVGISGAPASLLPVDAIQEFNLQGQFSPEYGRSSGSVVNIITKSGTNELHGSLFEYHRNSALDARNFFNPAPENQSGFINNQFGASVGGPIVHDRTFFFAAYEGQRERVASDFTFLVPTPTDIAQGLAIAENDGLNPATRNTALDNILKNFPTSATENLEGSVRDTNDLDNFIVKVDHQFTDNEVFSARYAFGRSDQTFPFGSSSFGGGSRLPQFAQESPTRVQVVSLSQVSTISATRINELRFGYTRFSNSFQSLDQSNPTAAGLNFGDNMNGLPEFDFGGALENLGTTGFDLPRRRTSQSFQGLDNFTWVNGKHTWKFGGEVRRVAVNHSDDNLERGIYSFSSGAPCDTTMFTCTAITTTLANFYLGNGFVLANNNAETQRTTYNNGLAFFGQDEFRIRSNLTVNYGLRWEYFGPVSEKRGLLSNLAADGTLALVGTDGVDGLYHRDLNNFAPRVSIAWSPFLHTVVRTGYGIYYDYIPQDLMLANFTNVEGAATNPIAPAGLANTAVLALAFNQNNFCCVPQPQPPGTFYLGPSSSAPSIFITDPHLATPYVQSWNFNIQQEVAQGAAIEIGYVGSKGTKLTRLWDQNQQFTNPNFSQMATFATRASSTYHALQVTGRLQKWHRFAGFASYTFSKSLDDASDGIDFTSGVAMPQNSADISAEHGPSSFDSRHRFTTALNYDVPVTSHLPRKLAEGWQWNTIVTAQSGRPIPIDIFNGNSDQRPDILPGVNPILPNWNPATGYLNPNAFTFPANGVFGDLGRNAIYGPGFWNIDFSITKNTKLTERLNLQFRAEFFNIFNHPIFSQPNNNLVSDFTPGDKVFGPAGQITQTPDVAQGNPGLGGGGPRVLQFALRLAF